MTGTWPLGWQVGDVEIAAQYGKGIGALFDSTLGGSAATIDITGIVGSYAHLMVWAYARGDAVATSVQISARFNGDTAANYDIQTLQGVGGATGTLTELFAQTACYGGSMTASTASASLFASSVLFIPNYASSSNNKACVGVTSVKTGTSTNNMFVLGIGGFWRSSAAITRITLLPQSGNFVSGTRVTVYGMGA